MPKTLTVVDTQTEPQVTLSSSIAILPVEQPQLPSANVQHAQILHNEMRTKLTNYEQNLMLLKNEADNIQAKYESEMADVQRRIRDHEVCKAMATSSIMTYEEAEEK